MLLFLLLTSIGSTQGWFYGRPLPNAWTNGGIWPLPQQISYGATNRTISPGAVEVDAGEFEDCDVIQENVKNYVEHLFFPFPLEDRPRDAPSYKLTIRVKSTCPLGVPQQEMNETYSLRVSSEKAVLEAPEVWGIVRGLETFSQLIYYDHDSNEYKIRTAIIYDYPRFSVRGILIDTSRHFLSMRTLKRQIDLMAQSKMNLMHWHIVDSEAYPYDSLRFPQLAKKGAYSKRHIYSRADVKEIIAFARIRGIRVMPEFDTPGHMGAWGGQPNLLTECYDAQGKELEYRNLIDPTRESTFQFLEQFLAEVTETFPESFVHLGGDEVADYLLECWQRNDRVMDYMRQYGFGNNTIALQDYYFNRLEDIVKNLRNPRHGVFWEEVFDNNQPEASSVIHLWKSGAKKDIQELLRQATLKGHRVILSSCWYLNYVKYGADWINSVNGVPESESRYYYCDPQDFNGTQEQKDLVLGGIAALWGEFIDNTNIENILWPRASTVAERLWSPAETTTSALAAWPRLHELRCRQVARGYRIAPIYWPDYCPFEYDQE